MKPLRIIQVIPDLRRGGAERLVTDICSELSARNGVTVLLVTLRAENGYPESTRDIQHVTIHSSVQLSLFRKNLIDLEEWEKIVRDFNPHVIHSHLYESEIITREHTFPGIRYFSHFHDNMPVFGSVSLTGLLKKKGIIHWYEKQRMINRYKTCNNGFICISGDTYAYARKMLGEEFRYHLLLNAIRFSRFYSTECRKYPGPKTLQLLNIGSMVDKKNQVLLIEVAEILVENGFDIRLTLVGEGPNRQQLIRKVKEKGLEKIIDIPGESGNVEQLIHAADLYVHAATYEPLGLVMLEAMAGALPVVALNGRGNTDIVINGLNGYLVEENDPAIFAETISRLIADKALYEHCSANAVTFARGFDISSYVDRLLEIYRSA